MTAKLLKYKTESRQKIQSGVTRLARAVKTTLGPKGRNVLFHKAYGAPQSTKDGVTVAKEIVLKDPFDNLGAQLVKEVSSKTCDAAGDGTTTAVVLAEAIYTLGHKNVEAGADPILVKRGMDQALAVVLKELKALSKPVAKGEDIENIATISANNDPVIGKLIADAMDKVGKEGVITAEDASGFESSVEVTEGMHFDKGYLSPYFVTDPKKMSVEFKDGLILLTDKKLSTVQDIVPILEMMEQMGKKPLLIIAEDIDGEALTTLIINKVRAALPVCAVKAPAFGDRRKAMMQDIAALTGATVISEEVGLSLEEIRPEMYGRAKTITIDKEGTTIVDGQGSKEEQEARKNLVRRELEAASSDYDREKLQERLAKLTGGVAVIYVGAATEAEQQEKKARVEDALHATRAAVQEGIVPGGGVALLRTLKALEQLTLKEADEMVGRDVVAKALRAPAREIAINAGENGDLVVEKILAATGAHGYNALTGAFEDLIQAGVVDPVKVTRSALTNAISVAGLMLTVDALIVDKPQPKEEAPMDPTGGMGMGGMGGMGGMMPGMM